MGIDETLAHLRVFVAERNWEQFHTPENLAKSISIEAAELLECYQWSSKQDLESISKELADVLTYCLLMADKLELNPLEIVLEKLEETKRKYPVEKARGTSEKYDRL
jgi:NTP pyrophosphatase (non-canonical NTP hydrolase)